MCVTEQIIFRPHLSKFSTFAQFAESFDINENDLIFTERYILSPFFDCEKNKINVIYLEDYGTGEPTDKTVNAVLKAAEKLKYNRIIAAGGGSVLDIAKVIAVYDGKDTDWMYDHKDTLKKHCKLVLIPTTCGTGSEVTNIAIMNRLKLGTKMGLTSSETYADEAVLIPELLKNLPFTVFATSSIDALVHAVESSLSPKATEYTKLFGYKAVEMILTSYKKIVSEGKQILPELIEDFLIAANFAGLAFGTAGCAAVHALSYPLSGVYHVPHGESNYAMFTGVLKYYMRIKSDGEIAKLNDFISKLLGCDTKNVYDELENLLNNIIEKKALHKYGVRPEELPEYAKSVIETQQRLMVNSFVPLDEEQVLSIYKELY